jgi:hypothetical protein
MDGKFPLAQTLARPRLLREISRDKPRLMTMGCHKHKTLENTAFAAFSRVLKRRAKKWALQDLNL